MKISEVLRATKAILWDGYGPRKEEFICIAISKVVGVLAADIDNHPAVQFLVEMGMPLSGSGFCRYDDESAECLPPNVWQELRHTWLDLAITVAEEEGL